MKESTTTRPSGASWMQRSRCGAGPSRRSSSVLPCCSPTRSPPTSLAPSSPSMEAGQATDDSRLATRPRHFKPVAWLVQSGVRHDGVVFKSLRPAVDMDELAVWCKRWLGAPPAAELFESGYLWTVKGLRLADGREVVVKVRPSTPRLAGCAVVHRALWTAGFPCPEPLVDQQPLDGFAATAEALIPGADEPPPDSELGLWPTLEDRDVDLNDYPEPRWLARVASAVRDRLRGHGGDPVIGHSDWHPGNLCWQGPQLIAVHDWD